MAQDIKVILDLSDDVQTFLEQQDIHLYDELLQAMPSLRTRVEVDPDALEGSRGDVTTVILAVATLASSLTPLIIRILNQYTPPNRSVHWEIVETETQYPDKTVIQRKHVMSRDEQRPWAIPPSSDTSSSEKLSPPHATNDKQP